MKLVRLPTELLLEIVSFQDLEREHLLTLRLVHPVLAKVLTPRTIESIGITLAGSDSGDIDADSNDKIKELTSDERLLRLRSIVSTLKIWIPCPNFYTSTEREDDSDDSDDRKDLAESGADKAAGATMQILLSSLPRLQNLEMKGWCGRGGHEVTRSVLRGLGTAISAQVNLSVFLYGLGEAPGQRCNCTTLHRVPATTRVLELHGNLSDSLDSLLEQALALILVRCRWLSKFILRLVLPTPLYTPRLRQILQKYEDQASGPLAIRELDVDINSIRRGTTTRYQALDGTVAARLPNLRCVTVSGQSLFLMGFEPSEFWPGLLNAGIWVESITTETVGPERGWRSELMDYLSAPQVGHTLKVLNLQRFEFHWRIQDEETRRIADMFWERALPNVAGCIEDLTLLVYARDSIRRNPKTWAPPFVGRLHEWSLSHETLVQRQKVLLPRLKKLTTYAVLDRAPESEEYFHLGKNEGYCILAKYDDDMEDGDTEPLKWQDVMDYITTYCPNLLDIQLYLSPGRALRVEGNRFDNYVSPEAQKKVVETWDDIQRSSSDKLLRSDAHMTVSIIQGGAELKTVATNEFFYSSGRWHRLPPPSQAIPAATHTVGE